MYSQDIYLIKYLNSYLSIYIYLSICLLPVVITSTQQTPNPAAQSPSSEPPKYNNQF